MRSQDFGTEKRIQASPLSTRVADAIREAIICGELRQGQSITQESIAKMYSVSTMPAREALLALSHEGMIEARPNRGFRVARMARQDVEDIYWAHSMLSSYLTRRACERRSDDVLKQLEENLAKSEAAFAAKDFVALGDLEWDFHSIVNVAADSPKIAALLTTTIRQIPQSLYRKLHETSDWERACLTDHAELVRDVSRRNAKKAEETAAKHVATTSQAMIERLAASGYWDTEPNGVEE